MRTVFVWLMEILVGLVMGAGVTFAFLFLRDRVPQTIRERARALWRLVCAPFTASSTDPRTGDTLSAGERWSWRTQLVMRRWPFLLIVNVAVTIVWTVVDPIWYHTPADIVNYLLSLLAIDIEGLTAMALINQTVRDAIVNRAVRRMEEQNVRMEREHGEMLAAQSRQIAAIYALLNADLAARVGPMKAGGIVPAKSVPVVGGDNFQEVIVPPPAAPRRSLPSVLADQQQTTPKAPRKRVSERAKP